MTEYINMLHIVGYTLVVIFGLGFTYLMVWFVKSQLGSWKESIAVVSIAYACVTGVVGIIHLILKLVNA